MPSLIGETNTTCLFPRLFIPSANRAALHHPHPKNPLHGNTETANTTHHRHHASQKICQSGIAHDHPHMRKRRNHMKQRHHPRAPAFSAFPAFPTARHLRTRPLSPFPVGNSVNNTTFPLPNYTCSHCPPNRHIRSSLLPCLASPQKNARSLPIRAIRRTQSESR